MFLQPAIGQTLAFHPIDDPPGGRAFSLGDRSLAELTWSRLDDAVRIETDGGLWRARFGGVRVIRGVIEGPAGEWQLLFAGTLVAGLAQSRAGSRYEFFRQVDREHGTWIGIDDAAGDGVLRVTGRISHGGIWSQVHVTPEARHREVAWPLLFLWGGLRILGEHRPWLRLISWSASRRSARHALDTLASRSV